MHWVGACHSFGDLRIGEVRRSGLGTEVFKALDLPIAPLATGKVGTSVAVLTRYPRNDGFCLFPIEVSTSDQFKTVLTYLFSGEGSYERKTGLGLKLAY